MSEIKLKKIIKLRGDRGHIADGTVNKLRFKASLQRDGWKPIKWVVYHLNTDEAGSIQEAEYIAELQADVKNYLNNEHYPPGRVDEYE